MVNRVVSAVRVPAVVVLRAAAACLAAALARDFFSIIFRIVRCCL